MTDPYDFLWDKLFEQEDSKEDSYYEQERIREKYYKNKYGNQDETHKENTPRDI